jgi:hypothetical protein
LNAAGSTLSDAVLSPMFGAISNADASSLASVKAGSDEFQGAADSLSSDTYSAGDDSLLNVQIVGVASATVDANPFHDAKFAAIGSWTRNFLVWLLAVIYIGWAQDYLFKVIENAKGPVAPPSSISGAAWQVAASLLVTVLLASLPVLIMAWITTHFGGVSSVAANPIKSDVPILAKAVELIDNVLPIRVVLVDVVSGLAFRLLLVYYLKIAQAICRI